MYNQTGCKSFKKQDPKASRQETPQTAGILKLELVEGYVVYYKGKALAGSFSSIFSKFLKNVNRIPSLDLRTAVQCH